MGLEDGLMRASKTAEVAIPNPSLDVSALDNNSKTTLSDKEQQNMHDKELVELFNTTKSDKVKESILREIMAQYRERIFNLALSITHDRRDAEEMVLDVFKIVYKKMSTFKGESTLYTWIYRIAENTSKNRLAREVNVRKRDRHTSFDAPLGDDNDMTLAEVTPQRSSPSW